MTHDEINDLIDQFLLEQKTSELKGSLALIGSPLFKKLNKIPRADIEQILIERLSVEKPPICLIPVLSKFYPALKIDRRDAGRPKVILAKLFALIDSKS